MSDHHDVGYDKQDPNAWAIGASVGFILLFTFISGWVVQVYFDGEARATYSRTVLQAPNEQLNKLRADADTRLHKYGWVDQKAGMAHMPIEDGMKMAMADIKAKASQPASVPVVEKKKKK